MKHFLRFAALPAILFFFCASAFAVDYGALLSANYRVEDSGESINPDGPANRFTGFLSPWVSLPLSGWDFYASASLQMNYSDMREDNKLIFIPELSRLELSGRPVDSLFIKGGRISWQDASGLAAGGRFDGAEALWDLGKVRLGAAAFYTGLLYDDTANINVSPSDPHAADYSADLDWNDFADTYFAPRRIITSVYGDFPGFPVERGTLHAGIMAQFDLSDADERFHTQYLLLRYTMMYEVFDFAFSGALELENTDENGTRAAFAFSAEAGVQLSESIKDRLSAGIKFASGDEEGIAAFFPVVREELGTIIKPYLSGMMMIHAGYEARILPTLSAELAGRYFIRTDDSTFFDPEIEIDSPLLGLEMAASLLWVPFSDLSFSLGGGLFIPQTGAALQDDADVRWLINLGTIFSF